MQLVGFVKKTAKQILPYWVKGRIRKYMASPLTKGFAPSAGGLAFSGEQQPLVDTDPVSRKFHQLGPWLTKYEFQGREYGGKFSYAGDDRVRDFSAWLDVKGKVLELGSFEAAHTSLLSADPRITSVLGLDGRIYLVERGNFIKELFHNEKIAFDLCDFEIDSLKCFGRFDAVFCSGVLYHLTKPWRLLRNIAQVSDRLFLSTHFANEGETSVKGYKGTIHGEFGFLEPLSGLDNHSFWPTLDSLKQMVEDCGFTIVQSKIYSDGRQDPLANFYCHVKKK